MRAEQARQVVGSMMRAAREGADCSLKAAASSAGWDKGHLSRVERGVTRPSRALVTWYDTTFDTGGVLERTWAELDEAVRAARQRSLADRGTAEVPRLPSGSDLPADHDPEDGSELVDETVPDGWIAAPGEVLDKQWTLRVTGTADWHDRWLTRLGSVPDGLRGPATVAVPDVRAGDTVTVSVVLRCPELAGTYAAYFVVTDRAGRRYLPRQAPVRCLVRVLD